MSLSALDFTEIENSRLPFGVSSQSVADTLRKIGDMIESGELCVHSARVMGQAGMNAYTKTSIRLVLTEKHAVSTEMASQHEIANDTLRALAENAAGVVPRAD
jgi:hypothetical protein